MSSVQLLMPTICAYVANPCHLVSKRKMGKWAGKMLTLLLSEKCSCHMSIIIQQKRENRFCFVQQSVNSCTTYLLRFVCHYHLIEIMIYYYLLVLNY